MPFSVWSNILQNQQQRSSMSYPKRGTCPCAYGAFLFCKILGMSPSFPTLLCHNFSPLFLNWAEILLESHHRYSRTWSSWCANVTCMCVRAAKVTNHLSVCIPSQSLVLYTHTFIYTCLYIHRWQRASVKQHTLIAALSHLPMKSRSIRMDSQLKSSFPPKSNCIVARPKDWYYKLHDI